MVDTHLPPPGLVDRLGEREELDRLVAGVHGGQSRVLVLRGEAGVGKTALLEHIAANAPGCRIARAAGVESEMELPYAGLHALCAPLLDRLQGLPGPQRDALRTAFGLIAGPPPDRFMVGLAVLSLLADVAEERPFICIVDDAQWLDHVSAQTLAFVARRLLAERLGLIFALREPTDAHVLDGLPELVLGGLAAEDARLLLDATIPGPLDERVLDRILGEAGGNPLALLELPRGLKPIAVAGGFGLPGELPLTSRIEQGFVRRLEPLPAETRRLVLLAAAEPVGDVTLLWRAAELLGIGPDAAAPAQAAGLVEIGARVRFRHPLVRSAAYRAAPAPERREVHRALAEATDAQLDPDRRAWHRAYAAEGPDEAVAGELERSAGRAQARGGLAAAAAFLEQATALTPDPAQRGIARAGRGRGDAAGRRVRRRPRPALHRRGGTARRARARADRAAARADRVRLAPWQRTPRRCCSPRRAGWSRSTTRSPARRTWRRSAPRDSPPARRTRRPQVARAVRQLPPRRRRAGARSTSCSTARPHGSRTATPPRRRSGGARYVRSGATTSRWRRACAGSGSASSEAAELWDDESWTVLVARHVDMARAAGALSALPLTLHSRAVAHVLAGELGSAASLVAELDAVEHATGTVLAPYAALTLAAWRGRGPEFEDLLDARMGAVVARGEGTGLLAAQWARAVLANSLGQHDEAIRAAREAAEHPHRASLSSWSLGELVEAAARSGRTARGRRRARAPGADHARGRHRLGARLRGARARAA